MENLQWVVMAACVLFGGLTFLRLMSLSRDQIVRRARSQQARDRELVG
jgi:hypothetical protein